MKKVISILLALTVILASMVFATVTTHAGSVIESAIAWAEAIANDNSHLYSQSVRWGPSYDCSSFVISAFNAAGVDTGTASWTGNMKSEFTQHGFTWIDWSDIGSVSNLQRGDVLLYHNNSNTSTAHTEIYIGNNMNVGAHSSKKPAADQISVSGYYWHPWHGVLRYNENPNFPGEEDTSWNVGKVYYANSRLNTYNSSGVQESGRWIDAGDDCYVEKVFKNGYAWVEYPSGDTRRWAYTLASGFSLEHKGHDPVGVLDGAEGKTGAISLSGWAFDEDDMNAQLNIHVYIGGGAGDPNAEGYGGVWASNYGSDVNKVYGCGDYHRFSATIPTKKTGEQPVFVYAINVGNGNNKLIGSSTVNISADSEKPTVENKYFDQVTNDGFCPCFTVKDNVGIKSVKVAVWSQPDQSDLIWHNANNNGYGTYYVTVNRADYSNEKNSVYQIHAYIKDYSGNEKFAELEMDYRIKSETGKNIPEGEYRIVTAVNENRALDVYDNSIESGANIQVYSNLQNRKQKFNLKYCDNGFYGIINSNSNHALDVSNDTYLSGTNVIQYTEHDEANQQWMIQPTGDGYYKFIARSNGLALDVYGGYDKDETNVQVWTQNDSLAQKWKLRRVLNDDMVTIKGWTRKNGFYQPDVMVVVDGQGLIKDKDYTVSVYIEDEMLFARITGIGNYCDSVSVPYNKSSFLGDADGDGEVSTIDVTLIQRAEALFEVDIDGEIFQNGDVNGDGVLDVVDATWLQRYLALMDVPFAIGEAVKTE